MAKPSNKLLLPLIVAAIALTSCWPDYRPGRNIRDNGKKVWAYRAVYGVDSVAKKILYTATAKPVVTPGNIYAYQKYIFQLDNGLGIHVIDNSVPSDAKRIGFIDVKGCEQISIKDGRLFTNSYDDLVVLDFSSTGNVHEVSRLKGAFPEFRSYSSMAHPSQRGYFECPRYDSLVVGWVKDSVYAYCYN